MLKQPRIIIIGAGVSGIAAARKLIENGFVNTVILEAENRIGGRINTVQFGGKNIELGAQWCHGEDDNIVYSLAKDFSILDGSANSYSDLTFYTSSGEVIDKSLGDRLLDIFYEISFDDEQLPNEKGSFGDYFMRRYNEFILSEFLDSQKRAVAQKMIDWFHGITLCYNAGYSWFEISAPGLGQYELCGGNPLLHWKHYGFKTILDILIKSFPDEKKALPILDKIKLNKEVNKIIWDSSKDIEVQCSDCTKYYADHIIITTSLGVLKENYKALFIPELPLNKQIAIESLGIGTVNKIFLKFPRKWWPDNFPGFSFVWEHVDKDNMKIDLGLNDSSWIESIFGFYIIDSDPYTLMGWSVGKNTEKLENLLECEIIHGCMYVLNKFVGNLYDIPAPVEVTWSKWSSNPHFRGSYSFRSVDSDEKQTSANELSRPLTDKHGRLSILFAGEATHTKYYSAVHGALETGLREASRLIELYRNPSTMTTRIAVVGAGIAGLGAAITFLESCFEDFVILEASNRIGGRINTLELNGDTIELGAQWLHDSENYLYKLALENDLIAEESSEEGRGLYVRDDGFIFDEFLVQKIDFIVEQILEDCEKFTDSISYPKSVGHFLLERFQNYANQLNDRDKELALELLDWHIRFQIIDNCCLNLFEVSAKDWGKYSCIGKNGQKNLNLKNGYQSLLNVLVAKIPKENVKLLHPVIDITYNGDNVIIKCQFDRTIVCDAVILTPSIGYLKQNLINFNPTLPEVYQKCINSFGFHGMGKIFLVFQKRWWKEDGFQLIWRNNVTLPTERRWLKCLTGFDSGLNQNNILIGWIGGECIEEMERLEEEVVGRECVELLRNFLKKPNIPYPERTIRTTWTVNPWIKGGYSHTTPLCDQLGVGPSTLSKPLEVNGIPRLYFAGEATHKTHFSTTHGAFESGEFAAELLLNRFRKHKL